MSARHKHLSSGFTLVVPVSAKAQALAACGVGVRLSMPPATRREAPRKGCKSGAMRRGKHPLRDLRLEAQQ